MSNTKMRRNIVLANFILAVAAVVLAVALFTGCGNKSVETKNEASGGKVYVDYATEEDRILATDQSGAAERLAGIAALEKLNDHEKAKRHFRAGAEKGDRDAMMLYAICLDRKYVSGEKDEAATEEWLKKAAETGDPLALAYYGVYLVEENKKEEGLAYLQKSADAGCVHGQFMLGKTCMDEGDYARGLANLKKAASQPLTDKKDVMDYADDLRSNKGRIDVPLDLDEEYLTNANLAVILSQVMLGMAYYAGVATDGRDLKEAEKWLKMAQANGCPEVDEWLEELEKENR